MFIAPSKTSSSTLSLTEVCLTVTASMSSLSSGTSEIDEPPFDFCLYRIRFLMIDLNQSSKKYLREFKMIERIVQSE